MFDEPVRAWFPRVARPLVAALARAGLTPNQVTWFAAALGLAAAGCVATGYTLTGLGVWVVSRVADGLDGALARATGAKSPFGGYLDITLDMLAYAAMVVGFAFANPQHGLAWACILAGYVVAITTTLALSNAAAETGQTVSGTNRTFQFTRGVAEAGETTVMYVLWGLFPQWMGVLVWVWVGMLAVTGLQRSYLAWRVLR
ncbi:MAG: CDP-alcohol phosphatidyltransferase family protein [Acidobacteria bacterium]|nr:CDP-alcohol phosphatidyltransferase family protein [Acidobacteriota bacterium]